jgi:hypothetical protein
MQFKDLELDYEAIEASVKINNHELGVLQYLPIDKKGELLTFVLTGAIDDQTGCFSPLRIEVYYTLALLKYYAGIEFDSDDYSHIGETYDKLDRSGCIDIVLSAIPEDELQFMEELMVETVDDVAQYNTSFSGTLSMMSGLTGDLSEQVDALLGKLKENNNFNQLKELVKSN